MKNSFKNGKVFTLCCPLFTPEGYEIPRVELKMARPENPTFKPILGKLDTGAVQTMLKLETASNLGIINIKEKLGEKPLFSASGHKITYYVHEVIFRLSFFQETTGEGELFTQDEFIEVGFGENLQRNLFGKDLLKRFCVVFDPQKAFFLSD